MKLFKNLRQKYLAIELVGVLISMISVGFAIFAVESKMHAVIYIALAGAFVAMIIQVSIFRAKKKIQSHNKASKNDTQ